MGKYFLVQKGEKYIVMNYKLFASLEYLLIISFFISNNNFAQDSLTSSVFQNIDSKKISNSDTLLHRDFNFTNLDNSTLSREWDRLNLFKNNLYKQNDKNLLPTVNKRNRKSFIDSPTFKIVLGTAIIFGTSAAYFKLEADNYDSKFMDTKSQKYLNKRNDFDIYSGISLGLLQINFGYLIYRFLSD